MYGSEFEISFIGAHYHWVASVQATAEDSPPRLNAGNSSSSELDMVDRAVYKQACI